MNSNFIKADEGKVMPSLVESPFIMGMAKILTYGIRKYSKNNWKNCDDKSRYKDALLRHIYAYLDGEELDKETGESHLHHASCNLMFLDYFDRQGE